MEMSVITEKHKQAPITDIILQRFNRRDISGV